MALTNDFQVVFTVILDITKEENKEIIVLKRNQKLKMSIFRSEVLGFMERIKSNNKPYKSSCVLATRNTGTFNIAGSFNYWQSKIDELTSLFPKHQIGFKIPTKTKQK
jgi:hypothetical protein